MAYRRSSSRRVSTRRAAPARARRSSSRGRRAAPARGRRAAAQTVRIVLETRADTLAPDPAKILSAREVAPKKAKF